MTDNPMERFKQWFEDGKACKEIKEPTSLSLATVGKDGQPSVRIVLLKGLDDKGFIIYTNLESHKSRDMKENPKVALCFYWMPLGRQVRVQGSVERVDDATADAYHAGRPRGSQIGAWASKQSSTMQHRKEFEDAIAHYEKKFEGQDVPRPPHWSGWRVVPERIEFWQEGEFRIHHRELFSRSVTGWTRQLLYP